MCLIQTTLPLHIFIFFWSLLASEKVSFQDCGVFVCVCMCVCYMLRKANQSCIDSAASIQWDLVRKLGRNIE